MHPSPSSNPGYYQSPQWASAAAVDADAGHRFGLDLRSLYFCGISFLLGILHPWTVSLVGQMPVGELLILMLAGQTLLWILLTSRLPAIPAPRVLGVLTVVQVIAFVSYVLSDIYRDSYPVDMVRGWMRMVFLGIDLLVFAILLGAHPKAFLWHQVGFALSFTQAFFIRPIFGDYWKFGFGFPLTIALVMLGPYFGRRLGALVGLGAISVAHVVFAFRSAAAACLLVAGLLALRYLPRRLRQGILFVGATGFLLASPVLVSDTFTSESARENRSNIERGAMLQAAWEGFMESPLIGQGSWFSKSRVMENFLLIRKYAAGNAGGFDHNETEGVTIHSQILVTLAEGGLFGGAFFVVYGLLLLWGMYYVLCDAPWDWLLPCRLFLFVTAFWDILMTPFSGVLRLNIAFVAATALMCWQEKRHAVAARRTALASAETPPMVAEQAA